MLSLAAFFAIIGTIGWGLSNASAKRMVERFGPVRAIVFRNFIAVSILAVASLAVGIPDTFTVRMLAFGIALSFIGYFPFIFFLKGLEKGKVGVVYPISAGWVILAALIGILFLGDTLTMLKAASLALIIIGVLVSAVHFTELKKSDLFSMKSGVPYALVSAILWGVVFAFFIYPAEALGGVFFALMVEGVVFITAFLHLIVKRERLIQGVEEKRLLKKSIPFVFVSGIGAGFGTMFINFGYATGEIAIVSAIAGAQIVVAGVFAHFIYGERLSKQQYVGILLVLIGIVCAAII